MLFRSLSAAYLDCTDAAGDEEMRCLNDEQHTLTAYCYLDSQVQEGGFVQLIAAGYGEYVFHNPVADNLRHWRIKPTPKILDKAKALYERDGAKIEVDMRSLLEMRKFNYPVVFDVTHSVQKPGGLGTTTHRRSEERR